jgi:hypothetical protein
VKIATLQAVVPEAGSPLALNLNLPAGKVVVKPLRVVDRHPLRAYLTGMCREPGTNSSDDLSPAELDSARSFCCST